MTTENGEGTGEVKITEADVAGFTTKLDAWGQTLAPAEQTLLHLLLARAEGTVPEEMDVSGYSLPGVSSAAQSVLGPAVEQGLFARRSWVKMGTPWIRSAMS